MIQFHRKVERAKAQLKYKVQKASKLLFHSDKSQYNPERKMFKENQSIGKYTRSSSEQERKVNALASGAEEGRDKLR